MVQQGDFAAERRSEINIQQYRLYRYRRHIGRSQQSKGDVLSGTTGLQVIVLAGSVNVQFSSGAVVDVTTGSEVKSGAALAENHRYLVAEDTTALFTVTGKTAVVNYCGFYSIASSSSVDYPAMAASLKTLTLFRGSGHRLRRGL